MQYKMACETDTLLGNSLRYKEQTVTLRKVTNMSKMVVEGKKKPQPPGTVVYKVQENDSMASIAAQFNSTVSELKAINRLMSNAIFPGQTLYVYDNTGEPSKTPSGYHSNLEPHSPQVSRRVSDSSAGKTSGSVDSPERHSSFSIRRNDELVDETKIREEFFRVSGAKYITDGEGIVGGTLLITCNTAMFDPCVSDPLCIERTPEVYHVAVPIDSIMQITIYEDIAAKVFSWGSGLPPPKIYRGTSVSSDSDVSAKVTTDSAGSFAISSMDSTTPDDILLVNPIPSSGEHETVADVTNTFVTNTDETADKSSRVGVRQDVQHLSASALEAEITDNLKAAGDRESSRPLLPELDINVDAVDELGVQVVKRDAGDASDECGVHCAHSKFVKSETTPSQNSLSGGAVDQMATARVSTESDAVLNDAARPVACLPTAVSTGDKIVLSDNASFNSDDVATAAASIVAAAVAAATATIPPTTSLEMDIVSTSLRSLSTIHEDFSLKLSPLVTESQPSVSSADDLPSPGAIDIPSSRSSRMLHNIISVPRFTPSGSFILPPDEDVFVDLSSGLFTTDPAYMGRVQDVSHLPAVPVETCFTIGEDEPLTIKASSSEAALEALPIAAESQRRATFSGADLPKRVTVSTSSTGSTVAENDRDEKQRRSSSTSETKVEMRDATPREVLADILNRTSRFELIARPAMTADDMPKYLCLRVGRLLAGHRRVTSPIESYKLANLKPEYWFSIPFNRVEALYRFFRSRLPAGIYGSDEEIDPASRGFAVCSREDFRSLMDIEYVDDSKKRSSLKTSISDADLENLPLPTLSDPSCILNNAHLRQLRCHLPAMAEGSAWKLSYSSEVHGYSLLSLLRHVRHVSSPVLLVIKNSMQEVFGAMLSTTLRVSRTFYGNGESYLFTFHPFFKKFSWSGENMFFVKCSEDNICIGCSGGIFGLWLDGDLWHGRSQPCATFRNDVLGSREDFIIRALEIWSFDS